MKETEKLQRRYDALVSAFVAPLLRGEPVTVDQPLAPGALHYFQYAAASERTDELDVVDRLHATASAIAPLRSVPWPERDLVALAMVAYNLAALTDPSLDRVFARSARHALVGWIDELLEAVGVPQTRAEALARHALLEPLADLQREDVTIRSWAYTYRFYGRPVPANVTAWPSLRMVERSMTPVDLPTLLVRVDAEGDLGAARRLRELLSRSPVTELLRPDLSEGFRFGLATLACLSDGPLRGGIARALTARGEWGMARILGAALGDDTLRLSATPAMLYYPLALVFEVQMTATFNAPGPNLPERLDMGDPAVARFAAVVPAFLEEPSLASEWGGFDPRQRADMEERAALLRGRLDPAIVEEVRGLVAEAARHHRDAADDEPWKEARL